MTQTLVVIALSIGLIVLLAYSYYLLRGFVVDTPFYPSRHKKVLEALQSLPIPKEAKTFIDLGSGDGRVVFAAASLGYTAKGIDINPFLTVLSHFKAMFSKYKKNVSFDNKNFLKTDLSEYDIVFVYIFRETMQDLKDKLRKELKPGAIIISNVFTFDHVDPVAEFERFKMYRLT